MMKPAALAIAGLLGISLAGIAAEQTSPYAGQQSREIKALSDQEVQDYLAGKGMGLAKAAELNGYPGPAHVLTLAVELRLTAEQRAQSEGLMKTMQQTASDLGRQLVDEERSLDRQFASGSITSAALQAALVRIGSLQGQIRAAHLEAHVAQRRILSPEQIARYDELRGYGHAFEPGSRATHGH